MTPTGVPSPEGPAGLLLSRDLIFTSKITGTARALGRRVMVAGDSLSAAEMLRNGRPKVVFVDLSAGEMTSPTAILEYRAIAPETAFVAFGSHVEADALAAAAAAGCDPVLPRSRFSAELPELISRYLTGPPE